MTRFAFSSAVYARHQGAILLVAHKRMGMWLPVGGELEPDETPLMAATRELREETGLEAMELIRVDRSFHATLDGWFTALRDDGAPIHFLGYEEHDAGSKGWHGTFSFLFDVRSRAVKLCDEHNGFAWVDGWAGEIAEQYPMPPNVRRYLAMIRHGGTR